MLPGRPYVMKIGARTVNCTAASPKYKVNVNTLEELAAKTLELNEIGVCNISLDRDIAFDTYSQNRDPGGFALGNASAQPLDLRPIALVRKETLDALGDHRADTLDGLQILARRGCDRVEVAELASQQVGHSFPHIANAQSDQQAG